MEHHYTKCNTKTIKCVNCDGPHIAIAPSCPVRKSIIENLVKAASNTAAASDNHTNNHADISTSLLDSSHFPSLRIDPTTNTYSNTSSSIWGRPKNNSNIADQQAHQQQQAKLPQTPQLPQQQQQPQITVPSSQISPVNGNFPSSEYIWNMKLGIVKSYAEMKAQNDPEVYLAIMNSFLTSMSITPIQLQSTDNLATSNNDINNEDYKLPPPTPLSYTLNSPERIASQGLFPNIVPPSTRISLT